jgi:hypothetical protein
MFPISFYEPIVINARFPNLMIELVVAQKHHKTVIKMGTSSMT